ncbi:HNH endonuclease [uncultured phage cr106_1]|uniref:HNH endonuclease n=1 Tax=uncultured phage cr106_1 TaxID=2772062 RepID=A0A7M1RW04_9CAUD|nr:HNH endonuclease [uncultured phage cr106_1]QOR58314.1 HNH endonuclease [uncultured phage cr106_1]
MEIWKDIVGYEGLYKVSNLGRIKNKKDRLLSPYHNTNGYISVDLYKNGKVNKLRVHRIVAEAFILNPNNLPIINHKNEDKTDNSVSNLEWCNYSYNLSYGNRVEKMFKTRLDKNTKTAQKEVIQYDLEGNILNIFTSISEASKLTGISCGAIWQSCKKGHITNKKFKWNYK